MGTVTASRSVDMGSNSDERRRNTWQTCRLLTHIRTEADGDTASLWIASQGVGYFMLQNRCWGASVICYNLMAVVYLRISRCTVGQHRNELFLTNHVDCRTSSGGWHVYQIKSTITLGLKLYGEPWANHFFRKKSGQSYLKIITFHDF